MHRRGSSDAGYTLVEMLVAIAVLAIIVAPLARTVAGGLRSTADTSNRLASSSDAQFLSIYLPPDLKSADVAAIPPASITCTGVTLTNPKLMLTSNVNAVAGLPYTVIVVYWVQAKTGGFELVRSLCQNVAAGLPAKSTVVVRNLPLATSVVVNALSGVNGYKMVVTEKAVGTDAYAFTILGVLRSTVTT